MKALFEILIVLVMAAVIYAAITRILPAHACRQGFAPDFKMPADCGGMEK